MENLLALAALAGGATYYFLRKPAQTTAQPPVTATPASDATVTPAPVVSVLGDRVVVISLSDDLGSWLLRVDGRILAVPTEEFKGNTVALVTADLEATAATLGGVDALIAHLRTIGYDVMAAAAAPATTAVPSFSFTGAKKLQPTIQVAQTVDWQTKQLLDKTFGYAKWYSPAARFFNGQSPRQQARPITLRSIRDASEKLAYWAFARQTKYPIQSTFIYFGAGNWHYPRRNEKARAGGYTSQFEFFDIQPRTLTEAQIVPNGTKIHDAYGLEGDAEMLGRTCEDLLRRVAAGDTAKQQNLELYASILFQLYSRVAGYHLG